MVEKEIQLKKTDSLYLLGDLIDRGPDSNGVLDYIFSLMKNDFKIFPIRGNHEEMFLMSRNNLRKYKHWLNNGFDGLTDDHISQEILNEYTAFFKSLPYYYLLENKNLILVHAGLNFSIPDPLIDTDAMLWTRDFPMNAEYLKNKKLIHGHTPMTIDQIKNKLNNIIVNLDGGCVYKNREGMGNLIGLNTDTWELIIVPNMED